VTRGEFTIGDLLGDAALGLELLSGGQDALTRPLTGAHAIELEHPAKWLDAGWMMLTMGVRLRNKPQAQRELIAELQDLGVSCLGFGVGVSVKSVPPALLEEARLREFPVVLVPEETQFRDIARAVFHSTVGIEAAAFQRLSVLQQNLTRAFADEKPLESIVQRLGRLVHATVAVMSLDGQVDAATGRICVSEVADQLAEQVEFPIAQAAAADYRITAAPVNRAHDSADRWLVVASRPGAAGEDLIRAAVQITAPLINGLLRMTNTRRGQDRAIRKVVLDAALDGSGSADERQSLGARISALGVDFDGEHAVAVLRPCAGGTDAERDASSSLEAWLHQRLEASASAYLLSQREEGIVIVCSANFLEKLAPQVTESWPSVRIGIGRAVGCATDLPHSHRDADIAARQLGPRGVGGVIRFTDLDVVTQLLAEVPRERFAATAGPIAAQLQENPIQLDALRAYFMHNRDVKAAADSIYLHPNTLRYRLERLEQTLGRSLRDPAVTASLYCVLTLIGDGPTVDSAGQAQVARAVG
jgi:PucR family transcriptional regulator, purine catabolism regulatory protein